MRPLDWQEVPRAERSRARREGVTCSCREALAGRGGGEERGEAAGGPVPSPAISSWYHCSKSTAGGSSSSIWSGARGGARRTGEEGKGGEGWRRVKAGHNGRGDRKLREKGREEGQRQEKEEKNSERTVAVNTPRAKRHSQDTTPRPETRAMPTMMPAGQRPPARSTPGGWPGAQSWEAGVGHRHTHTHTHTHSHTSSALGMAGTHRPPTLGEGVREAEEEEGSTGGRQVVGTRSREAEAQKGRPGAGAVGTGEQPHIAFSCSSVTYLGAGQDAGGNTRG